MGPCVCCVCMYIIRVYNDLSMHICVTPCASIETCTITVVYCTLAKDSQFYLVVCSNRVLEYSLHYIFALLVV